MTVRAAVIGSGNIGTDLMVKIQQVSEHLEMAALVGIDPASDGLLRARSSGVATTDRGVDGLLELPGFADVAVVFDATSAEAHRRNAAALVGFEGLLVDLTPAAIGPYVVPSVNLGEHLGASNVNMVTCGGQATIPVVSAISRVAPVAYAEIVASIASRSAGPGTRANIDEFTETTARAVAEVGGAGAGKAIIVLNPADPAPLMRDTVYCLVDAAEAPTEAEVTASVEEMVAEVAQYVPGYRLKQQVQLDDVDIGYLPALDRPLRGVQVSVFLEVSGAGHHLPRFAGNLDIMTSAALQAAERLSEERGWA